MLLCKFEVLKSTLSGRRVGRSYFTIRVFHRTEELLCWPEESDFCDFNVAIESVSRL